MQGGGKQLILDTVFGALLTTKSKQPPANAYMSYSFGESCSTAYTTSSFYYQLECIRITLNLSIWFKITLRVIIL